MILVNKVMMSFVLFAICILVLPLVMLTLALVAIKMSFMRGAQYEAVPVTIDGEYKVSRRER